ncbi:hypothetical protein [Bacteroides acidifaciens]|uniref:hypothetical protein n=1 Tax=Bacteroides acidifaciens TaxID=85831 RepID=UPI0025A9D851|nr:hypothetical protein [Bacteroides acidifaciens]
MRRRIEPGAGNRLYNRAQSASVPYRHSAVYRRPGLARLPRNKGKGEPNTPTDIRRWERCPYKQQAGTWRIVRNNVKTV